MTPRGLDLAGLALAFATLALAILWAFPLAFALAASLGGGGGVSLDGLDAYWAALTQTEVGRWYLNSLVTSAAVTAGVLAISAPCGYAISQLEFTGRRALWWGILSSFLVPVQALIVNHFLLMNRLDLINTWLGVILPQLIAPVAVIVYKRFFDAVPRDLREAAALDGAGPWQILLRIYLPLNRGVTAALAIIVFIGAWNAFLWPFLVVTRPEMMTITVAISQAQDIWQVGGLAAALLAGLPVAALYLLFQRRVTEAVVLSAGLDGSAPARPRTPAARAASRDPSLDLLKTMLVGGMISAHVIQLVTRRPGPWAVAWSDLVNLVTFSGFMLAFGLGLGLTAGSARPRPLADRLRTAWRVLLAVWASSFGFLLLVEREALTGRLALDVLTTRVLFGWSEFLTSFLVLYLLIAVARPWLVAAGARGEWLVVASALSLASTMVATDRLWPLVGGLVGHRQYPNFPLLAYLPWFLVGVHLGARRRPLGAADLALGLVATGTFALAWWRQGWMPERFPPSVPWILGPGLVLALYLGLVERVAPRIPRPDIVLAAGRHVLASLVVSNLAIFAIRFVFGRPVRGGWAILGASVALIALVTLWAVLIDRRSRRTIP